MNRYQGALASLTAMAALAAYGPDILRAILKIKLPKFFSFRAEEQNSIEIGKYKLSDEDRLRHTHVVGATGSGKTVLMETIIYEDIARGQGMLIIDPKGDRDLYLRIKKFCESIGRENDLHLISGSHPADSVRWNPCRLGSPTEIQSKLLNAWTFTEAFYQKACEALLLRALNDIDAEKEFSLADLMSELKRLAGKDENGQALFLDIFNLISGEYGEILCSSSPQKTKREISLLEVVRKNEILFLDLPVEGKSYQSERLGKMILQEMLLISGLRKIFPELRGPLPFSVFVDEFDAFATKSFVTFLNKGRSSKFMIHIFHQTLSDIAKDELGGINYQRQILGNINARFVFRQDIPEDAETWASFFGTESTQKVTHRTEGGSLTGSGSLRETREFSIHPDRIKSLAVGECIISVKSQKILDQISLELPNPKKHINQRFVFRKEYSTQSKKPELERLVSEYKKVKKEEIVL